MDKVDRSIIFELKKNARTPYLKIAAMLNVSEGTVRQRVGKLHKEGIIRKFTIEIKEDIEAMVEVKANPSIATKNISEEIKKITNAPVYEIAGRVDILCFVRTDSMDQMNAMIEKIRQIDGIIHTETLPVLKEI